MLRKYELYCFIPTKLRPLTSSSQSRDYLVVQISDVPRFATGLGERSFAVAGPKAWNSLPSELRCIAVDSTFRRRLKAELFSRAYGVSINI